MILTRWPRCRATLTRRQTENARLTLIEHLAPLQQYHAIRSGQTQLKHIACRNGEDFRPHGKQRGIRLHNKAAVTSLTHILRFEYGGGESIIMQIQVS